MARPNQQDARRRELIPELAQTFARLGYARATTAELAAAVDLRENQLYRLWPNKKAMFLAAVDYLYDRQVEDWDELLTADDPVAALRHVLAEEAKHRGESGLHRITFAGLGEADDPEIRQALARMYQRIHQFVVQALKRKQQACDSAGELDPQLPPELAAWSLIALGTLASMARELDLFTGRTQQKLLKQIGEHLAELPEA